MGIEVFPAAAGGLSVKKAQTFVSSGTFTLPSGYGASKPLVVDLIICGGGGGGGGGNSNTTANPGYGGGSGGSGCVAWFNNVSLTANATITIGAGGSGGAAGTTNSGSSVGGTGGDGGVTNVNSLFYAPGGAGGTGGRSAGASVYTNYVKSYGFYLPSIGSGSNIQYGLGGSGGSGGAGFVMSASAVQVGGSFGYSAISNAGITSGAGGTISVGTFDTHGSGQNSFLPAQSFGIGVNAYGAFTNRQFDIRGGGGPGGGANNADNQYGLGGTAGGYVGGTSGAFNQTTGDRNGATATVNGGGGGGGGGGRVAAAGAGGAGAAGYVTIVWYE